MSLQLAAQHLAAQGRGPDKQLVHMSPREVAGLQALAMSHGGSLSINPKTGLPEAGFLDSILPAVVGAGLAFATGGTSLALTPAMIGLGVGGIQALRTGDLSKGLMAGLGAYGGAGLFAGLAGAGAAGAGAAGAVPQAAATQGLGLADPAIGLAEQAEIARLSTTYPTLSPPTQYANPFTGQPNLADYAYGPEIQSNLLDQQARNQSLADLSERFSGLRIDPLTESQNARLSSMRALGGPEAINAAYGQYPPPLTVSAPAAVPAAPVVAPAPAPVTPPRGFLDGMSDVAAVEGPGVSGAGLPTRSTTLASRFDAMPTKDKFKYGLAALSPALLAQTKYKAPELDREQYRYAYTPGRTANRPDDYQGEYTYFRPQYARLAAGGPVEAMSAANVYAMQNARGGVSDMGIDNSTGMQRMAEGGLSGYKGYGQPEENNYTYDPVKQQYGKVAPSPVALAALADAVNRLESSGGGGMGASPADPTGGAYSGVTSASFDAAGMGEGSLASGGGPSGATADAAAASQANAGLDSAVDAGGEAMGMARGGISDLGDYSDGGRLLKGPGDGVSDSIPAVIGRKRPARLADGEFVVPARIVSELGNGSTEAGARKLYAMMDRIQKARGKTVGKGKVAKNSKAEKYLPA